VAGEDGGGAVGCRPPSQTKREIRESERARRQREKLERRKKWLNEKTEVGYFKIKSLFY
jgi:hypothetical protein